MKKIILLVLIFFAISVSSQSLVNNTIDISGGYAPDGFGVNATFNVILDDNYVKLGLYVSSNKYKYTSMVDVDYEIPYTILSVNGGYFIPFIKNRQESLILSGGLGVLAGYEVVNGGSNELENGVIIENKSAFIYGGFGTLEFEVALNHRMFILTKVTEYYHVNSDLGNATMYAGLGLRFYIN